MLKGFLERCDEVEERLQEMFVSYRQILPVTLLDASQMPEPTEPFFRVPQYYRIYLCIHQWYQNTCRHFPRERMLLNLYENTFVFEIYCLARLLQGLRQEGFVLEECRRKVYTLGSRNLYDHSGYQNVYRLERGDEELTLFFQPVLTDQPEQGPGAIHLYRNTTYAFKPLEEGHYYTPGLPAPVEAGEPGELPDPGRQVQLPEKSPPGTDAGNELQIPAVSQPGAL